MLGPGEKDYEICLGLASTFFKLGLAHNNPSKRKTREYRPTPFIQIVNGGQAYWSKYRKSE